MALTLETDLDAVLEAVAARWRAGGLHPAGGAPGDEIAAFERSRGVQLPTEIWTYFARLNGTREGSAVMDGQMICWWRLDELRSFAEEGDGHLRGAEATFVFADYLVRGFDYGLRLSADPATAASVVINHGEPPVVAAPSLRAFLAGYLREDWDVLAPGLPR